MENRPYNALLFDNYLNYLKDFYPQIDRVKLLNDAGIESWEMDIGHWFSQEEVERFYDAVLKVTGNPNIAIEAGRHTVYVLPKNFMRETALGFLTPDAFFDKLNQMMPLYCKVTSVTAERVAGNSYNIILNWINGAKPKAFQCDRFRGFLEAIVLVYRKTIPKIIHDECYFKNASRCVYRVTWERSPSQSLHFARGIVFCIVLLGSFFFVKSKLSGAFYGLSAAFIIAFLSWFIERLEKRAFLDTFSKQSLQPRDVYLSHAKYYDSMNIISEVGHALGHTTSIPDSLIRLSKILIDLGHCCGILGIVDDNNNPVCFQAIYLFDKRDNYFFDLNPIQKGSISFLFDPALKKAIIRDIQYLSGLLPSWIIEKLNSFGISDAVYIPISDKNPLGFILLKNMETGLKMPDLNLLHTIASNAALHFTNILYYKADSEKSRKDFITDASHEMLMPIQIANAATYKIKALAKDKLYNNRSLYNTVQILDKAITKLNVLGKNIISLSNNSERKADFAPVILADILDSIKPEIEILVSTYQHDIICNTTNQIKSIRCEKIWFSKLLLNLIQNAAKYTPPGGIIEVSFETTDNEILISVRDNGIGIEPEFHEKIFDRFFQITPNESGAGIGLSFCKEVVSRMGGYITLISPVFPDKLERKGSEFIIYLPINLIAKT